MLATKKTVRAIVQTLANLEGGALYRRQWADRAKDRTKVNMAFRFWDPQEADEVARRLQLTLKQQGYTNKVRRTSVDRSWETRAEGGEYVRVQAVAEYQQE